jgi:2-amino-4-hydroxy-6-hydroxymethyldihydropteridine diphosphokinase
MSESTLRTTARAGYVGLGSNMASIAGGPVETLQAAIKRMGDFVQLVATSSFYATWPVGFVEQAPFVNAVAQVRTAMRPEDLMQSLLQIEREFGRDRTATIKKGPRTLDLDLLLMGQEVLTTPLLTLPHPAMASRRFVLAPLAELAPNARHPLLKKTILEMLQALPEDGENGIAAVRVLQVPSG